MDNLHFEHDFFLRVIGNYVKQSECLSLWLLHRPICVSMSPLWSFYMVSNLFLASFTAVIRHNLDFNSHYPSFLPSSFFLSFLHILIKDNQLPDVPREQWFQHKSKWIIKHYLLSAIRGYFFQFILNSIFCIIA